MRWLEVSVASAAFIAYAAAAPAAANAARPTVTIDHGTVIGKATPVVSVSSTRTVYNYLGIPFASAPTGTLRFAPPATPVTLSKPLQATTLPPACPQQFQAGSNPNVTKAIFNNPGGPPLKEDEDCLYLNVFAPTSASPKNKKPVLFWIFGGNLQFGSGSLLFYNGSSFAGFQDVVVVTMNYRTNMFGFSNSPEIPQGQQNSGFLDQRAALQWVQKNIAAFGGDPTKVTIFGESAGGYSVKQLLANPPSPMPYRAAIMESEASLFSGNALVNYEQVVSNFGCTTAPSQLACLQKVPAINITNYIDANNLGFAPVNDGVTQVNDVRPNILNKKWADVPFLIGTNADEGNVFAYILGLEPAATSTDPKAAANAALAPYIPDAAQRASMIDAVAAQSPSLADAPYFLVSRVITDVGFACPAGLLSNFAQANGYSDVWRYYYNASYPNLSAFPNSGAFHSSEIPQVFGTYNLPGLPAKPTKDQEALSGYMQGAWANFAKNPTQGPGWAKLNSAASDVSDLGGIDPTTGVLVPQSVPDEFCPIYDPLYAVIGF